MKVKNEWISKWCSTTIYFFHDKVVYNGIIYLSNLHNKLNINYLPGSQITIREDGIIKKPWVKMMSNINITTDEFRNSLNKPPQIEKQQPSYTNELLKEWLAFYNEVIVKEWWGRDSECAEGHRAMQLARKTADLTGETAIFAPE